MKHNFLERLKDEIIVFDGAMGTELPPNLGRCPEELNLIHPEVVANVHSSYVEAGADVITANTFGGNRLKLKENGLEDKLEEINTRGIEIAREVTGGKAFVAASVGPTGKLLEPLGEFTFDQFYDVYQEQIKVLAQAGADIIILETMLDIQEAKIALLAVKENCNLPVICSLTFTEEGRMVTGSDPLIAATILEPLKPDVLGANCSLGPKGLMNVMKEFASATSLPLIVRPNAGLPRMVKGKTVYPATPDYMAKYALKFVNLGINIVGSCCGSGPEHTKAIVELVGDREPKERKVIPKTRLASRTKVVFFDKRPIIIGERINPTGKKALQEELRNGRFSLVRGEARKQEGEGARILDINVSGEGIDEARTIRKAVLVIEKMVDLPLSIDSPNPEVIEKALKVVGGKALINSVNGKEESLKVILPLAKRFGAAIIGLTLDEEGIPKTVQKRLRIAKKIIDRAVKVGISKEDIFIDTLALTVASQQEQVLESLKALRLIKKELGVKTILGISNISFGLPNRPLLNATFYHLAKTYGLDAAIINPRDAKLKSSSLALKVLKGEDKGAKEYIKAQKGIIEEEIKPKEEADIRAQLSGAIIDGNKEDILRLAEEALKEGLKPLEIIDEILIPAITLVGERYNEGTYFLPQLISSAEVMKLACERLSKEMEKPACRPVCRRGRRGRETLPTQRKIVMATVEGDIHDIGKNIVSLLLSSHGFQVVDLGKDVKKERIIHEAVSQKVDLIGLSALMTTTIGRMKEISDELKRRRINIPTLVGGAVVTSQYAKRIGATYAKDAIEAVKKAKELVKKGIGGSGGKQ
ncbi:homocysteine S-methyltransferase family protein [bacterium]|nr:homocysteine S-methyltransferase family protein [bacterium]